MSCILMRFAASCESETLLNRCPKLQLEKASDYQKYTTGIREGDLILMFSDGLRHNLRDKELLSIVNRALPPAQADMLDLLNRCAPETIAKALSLAGQERSLDHLWNTQSATALNASAGSRTTSQWSPPE